MLALHAALCALFLSGAAVAQTKKASSQPSKEALSKLSLGLKLFSAGQEEKGIETLLALREAHPNDPAAVKAEEILRDHGVGDGVRVVLDDRKVFRESFRILDKDVLAQVEKTIEELKPHFEGVTPFFEKKSLRVVFYDSEARYRKQGGSVTASGDFSISKSDFKARTFEGTIESYLPKYAATLKDRQLYLRSLFYHEVTHYWNAASFGGALPSIFEEGIATYLTSRLNTDYYQYYRTTDRDEIQSKARNSLNSIVKFEDFKAFLEVGRGFGQGGEMVSRWYGLCYAIADFFQEGSIGGKKSSFEAFLGRVSDRAAEAARNAPRGQRPRKLSAEETLSKIVEEIYGVKIEDFHKALVQHVLEKYRQR